MRTPALLILAAMSLAACGKGSKQADALDNAAAQSDPAAANAMRAEASDIRANGIDTNLSDPNSPAQAALTNAAAAIDNGSAPPPRQPRSTSELIEPAPNPNPIVAGRVAADKNPGARPHQAGQPVPDPGRH